MDASVIVALIAAAASLAIGIVGLFNQRRLEGLKKSMDFDTSRFERLREMKQKVIELSDANKHAITLEIKQKQTKLDQQGLFEAVQAYQEGQVAAVAKARQFYRINRNLIERRYRETLDQYLDKMDESGRAGIDIDLANPPDNLDVLIMNRISVLEEFIPELEKQIDLQLDSILDKVSGHN